MTQLWDRLGIGASFLCLIHCLVLPLALSAFPTIEMEFAHMHDMHVPLTVAVLGLALIAFIPGLKKHRDKLVGALAIGSSLYLLVMTVALGHHDHELSDTLVVALGSVGLIIAHLRNIKLQKCHTPSCVLPHEHKA